MPSLFSNELIAMHSGLFTVSQKKVCSHWRLSWLTWMWVKS